MDAKALWQCLSQIPWLTRSAIKLKSIHPNFVCLLFIQFFPWSKMLENYANFLLLLFFEILCLFSIKKNLHNCNFPLISVLKIFLKIGTWNSSDVFILVSKVHRRSWFHNTVFENHRKSLIQHCERSELRLHLEWTKVN